MVENIHWLGHASLMIMVGENRIYVDPWKLRTPNPASLVLVTHEHFDHCSPEDIAKIVTRETPVVCPETVARKITAGQPVVLQPGARHDFGYLTVVGVPAYNLSRKFHPKSRGDLGFLLLWNKMSVYIAGDTDFIPEMKNLHPEVAIVPVGGTYTMDAWEAAEAVNVMKPKVAIPIHFGDIVGSRQAGEEFHRLVKTVEVRILSPKEGDCLS